MIDVEQQCEDYKLLQTHLTGLQYSGTVDGSPEGKEIGKVLARWTGGNTFSNLEKFVYTGVVGELPGKGTVSPDPEISGCLPDAVVSNGIAGFSSFNIRKADLSSKVVEFGVHPSPFGSCLLGVSEESICYLCFVDDQQEVTTVSSEWKAGTLRYSPRDTLEFARLIFGAPDGNGKKIGILADGTDFQLEVWKALTLIPPGKVVSYSDVAGAINRPDAVRAVASAVAANPVSYLIPCHRVVRNNGHVHNYRWGSTRKRLMLAWETGRAGVV